MSSYWINFAASGNPNKDDLPEWPAYTHETDVSMELGDTVQAKQSIRKKRLNFFDEYYGAQD
jgi:carboxylesterase type B